MVVVLSAVCLMAFVVIPRLWWFRGPGLSSLDAGPGLNTQQKVSFGRRPGILRESNVPAVDAIIPAAV
jgi:hypothetical protein